MYAELREFINEHFSRDELMTFCADYFRDFYEDYEGSTITKTALARELVEHSMRRGEMPMLQAGLQNARPEPYVARFGRIVVAEVKAKPRNPRQVFLSYSTQDLGFAQRLADDLRAKGLPVWAAFDSIRPGESWTSAINRGLSESGIYVVVLSKHSVRSTWVKTETGIALTEHKRGTTLVIPLLVQECDVKQLSPLLTTIQLVDFRNDFAVSLANLLAVLDVWRGKEIVVQVDQIDRLKLRDLLLTHAISDDLRVICFDLGVNYEEVIPPSAVLTTAVINLITFFSTRGSLVKLAARVKRQFPDGQWNEVFVQAGESHKPSTTTPIEPHESDISSSASRRSNGPLRVFCVMLLRISRECGNSTLY